MCRKNTIESLFAMLTLLVLAVLVLQGTVPVSGSHLGSFGSPITTPVVPGPTPVPPVPEETQRALQYISEQEDIPVEQLVAANQHQREYELLGRVFWAVTLLDTKDDRWHNVMVDLADGRIVDDVEAIEQAEREAHRARYGKLEPALFEHLKAMKSDAEVPVAIWVAGEPKQSEEELYAALAAKYPEAQAALERSGNPFDVGDRELIHEIEAEYVRMLKADTQERIRPLVRDLKEQKCAVTTFGALPVLVVTLPKSAILELVERTDVGVVYLSGKKEQTELDSAVSSDRVPTVWQRGFEGNGVYIGILEGGKVDFTGPAGHNYLQQGAVRPCTGGDAWHKTMVASIAASFHPTYMGVAPEATIVDACTDGTDIDTVAGLEWATTPADPINYSAGFDQDNAMHFTDRAFDYWARQGNDTVTKSSSDTGGSITSPGKGWNVITVGGSDNQETSAWSDDEWWAGSGWNNPASDHRDREKPEVVAPAESITAVALDNGTRTENGTSLSAPQVSGLAALLIDRKIDLDGFPTAVKAIIMASAVNNVDGPSGIPTGQDLKDGAGAIDAALADEIAKNRSWSSTTPCDGPCWWGFYIDNTNFPDDTYLYRYFNASRGERVRVAISWWSNADCPDEDHCDYDRLDTDLLLTVYDKDGQLVEGAHSASWDNNYELVEFVAPKTGQYKIAIYKERADEISNYLGIAWVKDATYLPDLRNDGGWVSEFYVRNDGAEPRDVSIYYFDSDGNPTPKDFDTCILFPNQWSWIPVNYLNRIPYGTTGSAIVGGGEDVSVMVENFHSSGSRYAAAAYPGETAPQPPSMRLTWSRTGSPATRLGDRPPT